MSKELTEQWKKGELPDGYYYCKTENGAEILRTWRGLDGYLNFENMCNEVFIRSMDDCEVLAQVPSYEEWKASEKYNKHLEEVIKIYERKEKQHTDDAIAYNELAKENEELKEILERHKKATAKAQIRSCDIEIINAQLKELLRKAKGIITAYRLTGNKSTYSNDDMKECVAKIEKALGEDK